MVSNRHPDLNFMEECKGHYQNKAYPTQQKLKQLGTQVYKSCQIGTAKPNAALISL